MLPRRNLAPVYILAVVLIGAILASCTFHGTVNQDAEQRGVAGITDYDVHTDDLWLSFSQDANADGVENAGFYFSTVGVPCHVHIDDAELHVYYGFGEAIEGTFVADARANAPTFAADPRLVDRPRTTATVAWNYHNVESPITVDVPVAPLLQELVDAPGCVTPRAVAFMFLGCNCMETETGTPYSIEVGALEDGHPATLDVTYG